jgi:hypothetical protein
VSRDITNAVETETLAGALHPVLLVELQFSGGTVNFWTGLGTLHWDGKDWTGTGYFGRISPVEETVKTQAGGVEFVLSGIQASVISVALNQQYQGRPGKFWLGFLDDDATIVIDPVLVFAGRMDVMNMEEAGDTATISVTIENELIDLERPRVFRYTPEDHKKYFPGDTFFDQVDALQDVQIRWGKS